MGERRSGLLSAFRHQRSEVNVDPVGKAVTVRRRLATMELLAIVLTLPLGWKVASSMRLPSMPAVSRLAFGEMFALAIVGLVTMPVGGALCITPTTRRYGLPLVRFAAACALASLPMPWIAALVAMAAQ